MQQRFETILICQNFSVSALFPAKALTFKTLGEQSSGNLTDLAELSAPESPNEFKDGTGFLPAELNAISAPDSGWSQEEAEVTVFEGKFHQIKRMFGACGRKFLALGRLRIGNPTLDPDLPPGGCKLPGGEEIQLLLKNNKKNCI